jgi:hypothetical protein
MSAIIAVLTSKIFALFGGGGLLGIGARILGWDRKALELVKKIPPKGWLAIGIALALIIGFFVHRHVAHKAIVDAKTEQKAADDAAFKARLDRLTAMANRLRLHAEALQASATQDIRNRHDEEDRRSAALADSIRLRGPGAARCGSFDYTGVPTARSGPVKTFGSADAPVGRLPYPEWATLIGMPFNDTTRFAEQHDRYRNEVAAWHEWYPRMAAEWEKYRGSLKAAAK